MPGQHLCIASHIPRATTSQISVGVDAVSEPVGGVSPPSGVVLGPSDCEPEQAMKVVAMNAINDKHWK
jgi:hypothetical protein